MVEYDIGDEGSLYAFLRLTETERSRITKINFRLISYMIMMDPKMPQADFSYTPSADDLLNYQQRIPITWLPKLKADQLTQFRTTLSQCPNLKTLNFSGNALGQYPDHLQAVGTLFSCCPHLQTLNLKDNQLNRLNDGDFKTFCEILNQCNVLISIEGIDKKMAAGIDWNGNELTPERLQILKGILDKHAGHAKLSSESDNRPAATLIFNNIQPTISASTTQALPKLSGDEYDLWDSPSYLYGQHSPRASKSPTA